MCGNVSGVIVLCKKWCQDLSCLLSGLKNHPERSIMYYVVPDIAEGPLSNVPRTVDSTSLSAPPAEYLLQNMT
jgi:hypothetical protein